MTQALTPEVLDVTRIYIEQGFDLQKTSELCNLPLKEVIDITTHPQAKQYINEVYLDTGYRNRHKIGKLLDKIIDSKVEEAEESEMWSDMDLAELLKLAHKMRMDEIKTETPNTQVNIANFGDTNYSSLVDKLMNGKSK